MGFVSSDYVNHPVSLFLKSILGHLDRSAFHLIAYTQTAREDDMTPVVRALFDEWHEIRPMGDDDAADLVASHRVDVLVDLNGHTGESRLALFARRPARTQVSWLGYWATTGLSEIDFLLADPYCNPAGTKEWFSEEIYKLPDTRLCMSVPTPSRPLTVEPLPALKRGSITFGCYQQVRKITPEVMEAWSRILARLPDATLRLQTHQLAHADVREALARKMRDAGMDLDRITMQLPTGMDDYLASHHEVDILLDTFPYTGGTTTALGLWMGVPTLTLDGDTMLARQGAAMLRCLGLEEWVARDVDGYVEQACAWAGRLPALAKLRQGLRPLALRSPLFDARTFAIRLGVALRDMHARTAGRPQWTLPGGAA